MKRYIAAFLITCSIQFQVKAQIANGSIAPDFTLTDLNGTTHHLYSYLAEGKAVFIEFFACHCPSCWAYHNTHKLRDLYSTYGPDGTNEIMAIMLEHDEFNGDAFSGMGGFTAGDWITDNPVPMCDVEGGDRTVFTDYNMTFYPYIVKVCPDKTTENLSTFLTVEELYQKALDCPGELSLTETDSEQLEIKIYQQQLWIAHASLKANVAIYSTTGQLIEQQAFNTHTNIDLTTLDAGIYLVHVTSGDDVVTKRIYLD